MGWTVSGVNHMPDKRRATKLGIIQGEHILSLQLLNLILT